MKNVGIDGFSLVSDFMENRPIEVILLRRTIGVPPLALVLLVAELLLAFLIVDLLAAVP